MANAYVNLEKMGLGNVVNGKNAISTKNADKRNVVKFNGSKYIVFAECDYVGCGIAHIYAVKAKDKVIESKHDLIYGNRKTIEARELYGNWKTLKAKGNLYAKIHRLPVLVDKSAENFCHLNEDIHQIPYRYMVITNDFPLAERDVEWHCNENNKFSLDDILMVVND